MGVDHGQPCVRWPHVTLPLSFPCVAACHRFMTILHSRDARPDGSTARLPLSAGRRAVVIAVCILPIGCHPSEQIHSYNVPKETAPRIVADTAPVEPTERMMAAILPDGDKAWFFKVVGPLPELEERADKVTEFFASVRLAADKLHPDWQLSEGWQEQPGTGMRVATILIPTSSKPLELSVTSLPWAGDQEGLLSNVNRWRGQMQLASIGPQGLTDCTRVLDADGTTLTVVDLRGRMQSTGMTPPFAAGGTASPGGNLAAPPSVAEMPPGHASFSAPGVADHITLKYELPDGWQTLPAKGIRKAAFRVANDGREAIVTVTAFSTAAGPMIVDPLANVNRWRSEVGLEPLAEDGLSTAAEPTQVDSLQAIYVEAIPDVKEGEEQPSDRGTLAAMAIDSDVVWFFKITGDRDLIAAQRDQFKSLLKSVQFTARDESSDAN